MNLVIVESLEKLKQFHHLLDGVEGKWRVATTLGPLRVLPRLVASANPPAFTPDYEPAPTVFINRRPLKADEIIQNLKRDIASAKSVYIATDPDDAGELAAWHIRETLGVERAQRIVFAQSEHISILDAIHQARDIDMPVVRSEEARRVADQLISYRSASPMSKLTGIKKLMIRRISCLALKLVVEREALIRSQSQTAQKSLARYGDSDLARDMTKRFGVRQEDLSELSLHLFSQAYCAKKPDETGKLAWHPTPSGEKIILALTSRFHFIQEKHALDLERNLERVRGGKIEYTKVIQMVYNLLEQDISAMHGEITALFGTSSGKVYFCRCGKPMVKRQAKSGINAGKIFWGCSGFPSCTRTANHDPDNDCPR